MRGNGAGGNGIHANAAIAPLHGEAAGESLDAGFGDGGRDDVSGADGRVGGGNAEDSAGMGGFEPAAAAGHGRVECAHEHDADDGLEGARREFFGASDEVSGGIVDKNVERSGAPDGIDHRFDGVEVADVAREGVDYAVCGEFCLRGLQNFFAAAADVDFGAEFEEALRHAFAQAGAAASDEDAFVLQEVGIEHGRLSN